LRVLAAHDSAPLAVAVQELNKRSNNFAAEQLLRTLGAEIGGRPGSWDKGLKAVDRYLTGIGIKSGSYQMQNGSGLYDSNRFSAEQIVTIGQETCALARVLVSLDPRHRRAIRPLPAPSAMSARKRVPSRP
jgi:D-alanyl-D-alanine carboxypeptidase/D-alanyl-D-alanine-endopeptidase (penicillin-binding protein 4)